MKCKLFAALCAIGLAGAAQAAPVSFGSLSSNDDGSTEIISDALNNLEWLRWDVETDLTYQETVDLISGMGARAGEGWAIADAAKARAFTDALFWQEPCSNAQFFVTLCGSDLPTDISDLLGDNSDESGDTAWFLSGPNNVGYLVSFIGVQNFTFYPFFPPFRLATRSQPAVLIAPNLFLGFSTATPPRPCQFPPPCRFWQWALVDWATWRGADVNCAKQIQAGTGAMRRLFPFGSLAPRAQPTRSLGALRWPNLRPRAPLARQSLA